MDFQKEHGAAYFEAWSDEGKVLGRSPSLGEEDLRRMTGVGHTIAAPVRLPDGRAGRFFQAALPARSEGGGPSRRRRVTVVVQRGTEEIEATTATLRFMLLGSGLAALVLALLAGALAIHSGLQPVARLTAHVDAIDARRLGERLRTEGLPRELHPPVAKLNELLARLEESFRRERRFSADASHELRTPLAGLRSILEVACRQVRSADQYRTVIEDALGVTRHMSQLVESLLFLARLDAHQDAPRRDEIVLRELVYECFAPCARRAHQRGLRFENRVPVSDQLVSDRERLRIVITNLVANAVEYTARGGAVTVQTDSARGIVLEVCDSGPALPADALERVFDRFFRLDRARSGEGEHFGIGLALVRALCETLDLSVSASNRPDGWLVFALSAAAVPRRLEPAATTPADAGSEVEFLPRVDRRAAP
jgi:signal transduction histidine kinase